MVCSYAYPGRKKRFACKDTSIGGGAENLWITERTGRRDPHCNSPRGDRAIQARKNSTSRWGGGAGGGCGRAGWGLRRRDESGILIVDQRPTYVSRPPPPITGALDPRRADVILTPMPATTAVSENGPDRESTARR